MTNKLKRRSFIQKSLGASIGASLALSHEERVLLAQSDSKPARRRMAAGASELPVGWIGEVAISRLICGGNLISGYAHSRDLIYVSRLLKNYFTDDRIMETWQLCEAFGVNTMIYNPSDEHAVAVHQRYRTELGGKIQYIAQLAPSPNDLRTPIETAAAVGAVGAFLVGNLGDAWTREGRLDRIREFLSIAKDKGLIAGVGGHSLRVPMAVEEAGLEPDFYMKTLHSSSYWSQRRPGQDREVIDNYATDNYWCMEPEATIDFMAKVQRPWMAYKVLAAGAIHPRDGFNYAFSNGADFAVVGMFDFQVEEDVQMATNIITGSLQRTRKWLA